MSNRTETNPHISMKCVLSVCRCSLQPSWCHVRKNTGVNNNIQRRLHSIWLGSVSCTRSLSHSNTCSGKLILQCWRADLTLIHEWCSTLLKSFHVYSVSSEETDLRDSILGDDEFLFEPLSVSIGKKTSLCWEDAVIRSQFAHQEETFRKYCILTEKTQVCAVPAAS